MLTLNKILFVRFINDFVGEKKDLGLNLLFIVFYFNIVKKIQIRWFLDKVFYILTLKYMFTKKSYVW